MSSEIKNQDDTKLDRQRNTLYTERALMRKVSEKILAIGKYPRPSKQVRQAENQIKSTPLATLEKGRFVLRNNYVTTDRHTCLASLSELNEIELDNMIVNKIHLGNYLMSQGDLKKNRTIQSILLFYY